MCPVCVCTLFRFIQLEGSSTRKKRIRASVCASYMFFAVFALLILKNNDVEFRFFRIVKQKKVVWVFFIVVEVCGVLLNFWKLPTFRYIKTDKFSNSFVFFFENYYTFKKTHIRRISNRLFSRPHSEHHTYLCGAQETMSLFKNTSSFRSSVFEIWWYRVLNVWPRVN